MLAWPASRFVCLPLASPLRHLLDALYLVRYNIDRLMSRTAAVIALVCALVGLVAAGEAAYVHYRMLNDPTYVSFCDVSTTVSCTQVYASRFSTFRRRLASSRPVRPPLHATENRCR